MPVLVRRRLLPGLSVVAREVGILQIGLDPPHRVLLPDLTAVRRLVAALLDGVPVEVTPGPAATALADLERAGLLADSVGDPGSGDADAAVPTPALLARHGPEAGRVAAAMAATGVHLDVAARMLPEAHRLLAAAGLRSVGAPEPDLVLVAADRVLARSRVDRWVRDGVPHLCLEARDGGLVVGPLVVPGATACLRCVDAHLGEHDPHRATVLDRLAERAGPAPYDELGLSSALAWAIRDLRLLVAGERPATWSATVEIDVRRGPAEPGARPWSRHPCCGCAWDVALTRAG